MKIPEFLRKWLLDKAIGFSMSHEVSQYIGPKDTPYIKRWYVLGKRNRFFNIYIHQILKSDYERALHDHPWPFVSIVLNNRYREVTNHLPGGRPSNGKLVGNEGDEIFSLNYRMQGSIAFRGSTRPHRVIIDNGPAWTLVFTGPTWRKWGFHCPKGWVPYKYDGVGENVFKGCPE